MRRPAIEHAGELIAEFDAVFDTRPLSEWAQRFDEHDVWWAPVQSIVDVIADPQAQSGFVDMMPRDGEEPFRAVATPVDFDGHALRPGAVPDARRAHRRGPRRALARAMRSRRDSCAWISSLRRLGGVSR